MPHRLFVLWRNIVHRDRVDRDLDDELRATVDALTEEKLRAGLTIVEAQRRARLELGGVEVLKEQVRDVRTGAFVGTVLQDLRFAVRLLARNPLFTLAAALSLAIGIGGTTTVFTIANGMLLRTPTGVAEPERVVDIVRSKPGSGPGIALMSYPEYLDIRERATSFAGVYAYELNLGSVSVRIDQGAERVFSTVVTTNFFEVLGVPAAAGRLFGSIDSEQPGASPVIVLSHRYWTDRFHADPAVIGRTIRVNNAPFTVSGVAAERFRGLSVVSPQVWIPTGMVAAAEPQSGNRALTMREVPWLTMGARLKPGVSRAQASAEVSAIGYALAREHPESMTYGPPGAPNSQRPATISAEPSSLIPFGLRLALAGFLALLMAVIAVVLVIACANLTGVLLARGAARRREMGVRTALGAGRRRLVRQLLCETVVLFAIGGCGGLVLARIMTSALVSLLPRFPVPVNISVPLDGRVVAFSLVISFVAALLAGLTPALQASKADVVSALKDDTPVAGGRPWLRNAFVVSQVALSILLVVTATLLIRGLARVVSVDHGFDPEGVEIASIDLSMGNYAGPAVSRVAREIVERLRATGGVQSATLADRAPGAGGLSLGAIIVPGVAPPPGLQAYPANWTLIEPGYFATLRIPLLAGRDFTAADRAGTEPVAIVGDLTARRLWPGKDALDRYLVAQSNEPAGPDTGRSVRMRVVGIVKEAPPAGTRTLVTMYVPFQQRSMPAVTVFARSADGRPVGELIRAAVAAQDPTLPLLTEQALVESQQNGPVETQLRIASIVAASVGGVGLLLAAIGIYGVTAHAVAQRTRELGIRLSLGATPTEVMGLILRQGMTLVTAGAAIGLALGVAAGRLLAGRRFGLPSADPLMLVGVGVFSVTVGLIACWVPTRRATKINAVEALRCE